jgi:hypothetical protein
MYGELKKIQKLIWKDDDRMDQDTLFRLQEYVAVLISDVAAKEKKTDDLIKSFPWLYK